jgi:hypothetical protein
MAGAFLRRLQSSFLSDKSFQVLKNEHSNGAIAFEREKIGAEINKVGLTANQCRWLYPEYEQQGPLWGTRCRKRMSYHFQTSFQSRIYQTILRRPR